MTLSPEMRKQMLIDFRLDTCNNCIEFDKVEQMCMMTHATNYFDDEQFSCPLGEF